MKSILVLLAFTIATQAYSMPTLSWKAPKSTALGNEGKKEEPKAKTEETIQEETKAKAENDAKRENGTANRVK